MIIPTKINLIVPEPEDLSFVDVRGHHNWKQIRLNLEMVAPSLPVFPFSDISLPS
jgi:hypothetical protein